MIRLTLTILIAVVAHGPVFADDGVTFRNDVMAVLSKAGCNQGVCHGNKFGKGGFKLSLRGQDPEHDFAALTRDMSARRVNRLDPERSLILLKPTMQVAHQGGRRFAPDSPEYRILHQWISAGLPADPPHTPRLVDLQVTPREKILVDPEAEVRLDVEATFSDGMVRDVTRMAVYETSNQLAEVGRDGLVKRLSFGETTVTVRFLDRQLPVRLAFVPARPEFAWDGPEPAGYVDRHVFGKLRKLRMNPSPVASDTVFLRRAYLDLLGILPTAEEARRFVADDRPDKRARLIDALLKRPEFADFWALKWSDILRNEEKALDRKGVQNFYAWIREAVAHGMPMDRFVREIISARGSTYKNPPTNYFRALRDPLNRAESTAQLFLGVRLKCAKCHNHPFDRWTQNDYYSWANLFARIDYKILENNRRDRLDKNEFVGEQIVFIKDEGEVEHPVTGQPAPPRFLGATSPVGIERASTPATPSGRGAEGVHSEADASGSRANAEADASGSPDRLEQLAIWLTSPANRQFARAQVNRIWYHLMGRGLVEPIDDFRGTNPPVNPELLEALADDFIESGYDLKHMIRVIMCSRTYQLSATPNDTNAGDEINFSHARPRRLSAEQMLDGLTQVTGVPVEFTGYPLGIRAGQIPGVRAVRPRDERPSLGDRFLLLFGKPKRLQTCECERSGETTLNQTFQMVSGPLINRMLTESDNRLGRLLSADRTPKEIIEELYWTALTRPPTEEERETASNYLRAADNRRTALEDITWALLNSNEFLLRR